MVTVQEDNFRVELSFQVKMDSSRLPSHDQRTPTVVPAPNFNPSKDAADLRDAMQGLGTDEDAIINVITNRSNSQRLDIAREYKYKYGDDLIDDLKDETSGDFRDVLVGLMTHPSDYYARELYNAVHGVNESILTEILCTLTNSEIKNVRQAYQKAYAGTLEADIESKTSGEFRYLLLKLCSASRDETGTINQGQVISDAESLANAGYDGSVFSDILCTRSFAQLRLTFVEYNRITHQEIEQGIISKFSGVVKDGYLALVSVIRSLQLYFARRLYDSIAGIGTNDEQLIRVIVGRCEIDMVEIKAAYEIIYGESLESAVSGDTSGDYRKTLLSLIKSR